MLRKPRNRALRVVAQNVEIDLKGFRLDLSPEEVIADLDFGVGPIAEAAQLVQEVRRETGGAA